MRKNLDSHYIDNLLQRSWRESQSYYHQKKHSITEADIIKKQTIVHGDYTVHHLYLNLYGGSNNLYDYIIENYGPVWEIQDDIRFEIVVLSLPKEPYFEVRVENPDGDDIINDYDLSVRLNFEDGPFIYSYEDGSSFNINPQFKMTGPATAVNFNGIWILNPGRF